MRNISSSIKARLAMLLTMASMGARNIVGGPDFGEVLPPSGGKDQRGVNTYTRKGKKLSYAHTKRVATKKRNVVKNRLAHR